MASLIVALAVGLAWLASVPLLRGEPDGRIGSRVGEPAPELVLEDLDGRRWTIADGEGRLVWVGRGARRRRGLRDPLWSPVPDPAGPGIDTDPRWAGTDGLPRQYFIGAEGTVLREVIGPLQPARMVAILEELPPG